MTINKTVIIVIIAGVFIGLGIIALYQNFTPLQAYRTQIDNFLAPFTKQISEHPLIQQAITYLHNPALLTTLFFGAAGLIYTYLKSQAQNKISEIQNEANTAINQTQTVAQDLLNGKDKTIQTLTSQLTEYKNSDLGSKLFDAQTLIAKQEKELKELRGAKTALERVLSPIPSVDELIQKIEAEGYTVKQKVH